MILHPFRQVHGTFMKVQKIQALCPAPLQRSSITPIISIPLEVMKWLSMKKMPEKNKYNFSQFQGSCWHSVVRNVVHGHIAGKQGKQAFNGSPLIAQALFHFHFCFLLKNTQLNLSMP